MISRFLIATFCLVLPLSIFSAELSSVKVDKVIRDMSRAFSNKDAANAVRDMAPGVTILLRAKSGSKIILKKLNLSEYKQMLELNWKIMPKYRAKRSNTKISFSKDEKKVVVTSRLNENTEFQGKPLTAISRERITIKLIEGKLAITSYEASQIK